MESQATAFQWNAGGWFGAQIGGSCWMLIAAVLVLQRDAAAGLAALGVFAGVNVAGTVLWATRSRWRPLPAMQVLIVVSGAGSALATFLLDRAGQFEGLGTGGTISAEAMYFTVVLLVAALLLQFYVIDRRTRGDRR